MRIRVLQTPTIAEVDGAPAQYVSEVGNLELPLEDLSRLSEEGRLAAAQQFLQEVELGEYRRGNGRRLTILGQLPWIGDPIPESDV